MREFITDNKVHIEADGSVQGKRNWGCAHSLCENEAESLSGHMPSDETVSHAVDFFKAFADITRVRILCALWEKELCVCDISALLEMSQSAISHQLRFLKQTRLVKSRREGKSVFYSLADQHVQSIINCAFEHINE